MEYILFNAVIYSLDKSIKHKSMTATKHHEKKSTNLWKDGRTIAGKENKFFILFNTR